MKESNEYRSSMPIPIGDTIIDFLVAFKMNFHDLSDKVGYSDEEMVDFFLGKSEVTQDFAEQLAKVFPPPANFWITLDRNYRNSLARWKKRHLSE